MKNSYQILQLEHLDSEMEKLKKITVKRPLKGWLSSIRETLGFTTSSFAKKVGLSQPRVWDIEKSENDQSVTLKTMNTMADALNCDFVYFFVPRDSLKSMVEEQALKIATEKVSRVSQTMNLESQGIDKDKIIKQIQDLKEDLLKQSLKKLWTLR